MVMTDVSAFERVCFVRELHLKIYLVRVCSTGEEATRVVLDCNTTYNGKSQEVNYVITPLKFVLQPYI